VGKSVVYRAQWPFSSLYVYNLIKLFGGAKRGRTADLLNAIQALSQLSYSPINYST
jgi:hypothetical protein